ncbi:MAG: arsenic-transporting ATPase [Bacteroidetes bacterium QS_9_68_14]|nr:MAG: arsenic-transporting ATPase [Bacteroidetes bacterium QS_9_68_14]
MLVQHEALDVQAEVVRPAAKVRRRQPQRPRGVIFRPLLFSLVPTSEVSNRILLFTGKGGTGKTTCAAATGLKAARRGQKTLVLSSDPAHSLSDAFDAELGPEPQTVAPNLDAQEVDLYYSMQKYWGNMRELMLAVFRWQGVEQVAAEELAALPGMNEGSVMLWLEKFWAEGDYDLIVLDSAPTGETLTLLTLPQATQWWLTKAFPFQKTAFKTLGFGVRQATGLPLDKAYDDLDYLFGKLEQIQEVLADPEQTSVRLVMNPEKMVIQEARRAYTYLQLYGYGVDAALVNRVWPEEGVGPAMQKYVEAQQGYLDEIEGSFAPLPILRAPHLGEEVFGLERLEKVGNALYGAAAEGDADTTEGVRAPAARLHQSQTYRVAEMEQGDGYRVELHLPFLKEEDVDVRQFGDQLVVQVENQRRHYVLPNFLGYYTLQGDHLREDGWLEVRFARGAKRRA